MVNCLPTMQETRVQFLGEEVLLEKEMASPSSILASFVKDKVSIGAWIYLWAFYFVPLIYISVFVPVPYCLDDCGFVVEPEFRQVDSSSSILLSQDCFVLDCFGSFGHSNQSRKRNKRNPNWKRRSKTLSLQMT